MRKEQPSDMTTSIPTTSQDTPIIDSYLAPELANACTDMLNINLQVPDSKKEDVVLRLYEIADKWKIKPFYKQGYSHTIPLLPDHNNRDKRMLLFLDHKSPNRPFIHISINPSKLTEYELNDISASLQFILGKSLFHKLYTKSNVSRLDIACDFNNIIFEDLIFNRNLQRSSGYYKLKSNGLIGTVYLGDKTSTLRFRIYDKKAKNKLKGIPLPPADILRIEAEMTPNIPLCAIKNVKNPFIGVKIYKLSSLIADNRLPMSFCDSIHRRGLTGTLQLLTDVERKEVNKLLTDHVIKMSPSSEIFTLWKKDVSLFLNAMRPSGRGFSSLSPKLIPDDEMEEYMYYFNAQLKYSKLIGYYVDPYVDSYADP